MCSLLIGEDPDAGKDWRQEEKGTTEDEMADGITDLMDMSLSKLRELVMDREAGVLQSMGSQRVGDTAKWLNNNKCGPFKFNLFVSCILDILVLQVSQNMVDRAAVFLNACFFSILKI